MNYDPPKVAEATASVPHAPTRVPMQDPARHRSLTGSALTGMLWVLWGKAGRALLQIGVLAVLARLVAPSAFGLVSAAFVFIEFAAIFAHIGLGKALVQHRSLRPQHIAVAFHTSVFLGLLLGAVTWLLAVPIASFFRVQALAPVLRVMAITFPLRAVAIVPESLLQRDLQFRWLANREIAAYAFGYGVVGIALAAAGWGAWALVYAHLAQTTANTVLLTIGRPVTLKVRPERQAFCDLLYFSGGYTLGRIANHFASQGDNLVVGRALGPAALGVYGRAFQLMAVPGDIIGDILDNVLFPSMAKVQDDLQRLAIAYRRGISLTALLMMPLSIAMYVLAPQVIQVLLERAWTAAIVPFQLLALGLLFRTGCRMSDALARARGFVYERAWRQGVYAGLVIGGAGVGQLWGVGGAAFGVLLALCANFILMAQLSLRIGNMRWSTFLAAHGPALLLASLSGVVVRVSSALMLQWSFPPAAVLAGTISFSACVVTAAVCCFPRILLGADGIWMMHRLRMQFPVLQYVPLPSALSAHAEGPTNVASSRPTFSHGLPRYVEAVVALAILIGVTPLLVSIAALVALTSSGPVLFRHRRVGQNGRPFEMLKFRTMRHGQSGPGVTTRGDARVTSLGCILRKTKLDELPELWNVVRGDMSLVGPRPEAMQYVNASDPLWREILRVRPGITDPVTLQLRDEEEFLATIGAKYEGFYCEFLVPYKLRGYREYLSRRTWKSDVAVIWRTIITVILPRRASAPSLEDVISSTVNRGEPRLPNTEMRCEALMVPPLDGVHQTHFAPSQHISMNNHSSGGDPCGSW